MISFSLNQSPFQILLKNLSPIWSLAAAFLLYPKVQGAVFLYLFEHRASHLTDVPVALLSYLCDPGRAEQPDSAEKEQLLVFLIQFPTAMIRTAMSLLRSSTL